MCPHARKMTQKKWIFVCDLYVNSNRYLCCLLLASKTWRKLELCIDTLSAFRRDCTAFYAVLIDIWRERKLCCDFFRVAAFGSNINAHKFWQKVAKIDRTAYVQWRSGNCAVTHLQFYAWKFSSKSHRKPTLSSIFDPSNLLPALHV